MEFECHARSLLLAREIQADLPIWLKLSLRGRFLLIAAETQGPELPVHFRESPTPNMAVLARAFSRWAMVYHGLTQLALLGQRIRSFENV